MTLDDFAERSLSIDAPTRFESHQLAADALLDDACASDDSHRAVLELLADRRLRHHALALESIRAELRARVAEELSEQAAHDEMRTGPL